MSATIPTCTSVATGRHISNMTKRKATFKAIEHKATVKACCAFGKSIKKLAEELGRPLGLL